MILTLKKPDILLAKQVLYSNHHRSIGVLIKHEEVIFFDYMKNCIRTDLHKLGVIGHTIALNESRSQFNPPKENDIRLSLTYPKSDFLIFDIAGIWVYRPNRILANVRLTDTLTKDIIDRSNNLAEQLITDKIDLCVYLSQLKKLIPCQRIGFIVKYIPYAPDCIKLTHCPCE